RDPRFWLAEPIWVTAEGQRTAPSFWPGSEAALAGVRPAYSVPYDPGMRDRARVTRVLRWLDLFPRWRPTFIRLSLSGLDGEARSSHRPEQLRAELLDRRGQSFAHAHGVAAGSAVRFRVRAAHDYFTSQGVQAFGASARASWCPRSGAFMSTG